MADHHDDKLDSALDLLRSRSWAGPSTHPTLEKQFMQRLEPHRPLNTRLILGIAGALIGFGAVAAAARPAWRSAVIEFLTPAARASATPARSTTPPVAKATPRAKPTTRLAAIGPMVQRSGEPSSGTTAPAVVPASAAPAHGIALGDLAATAEQIDQFAFKPSERCTYADAFSGYVRNYMSGDKSSRERIIRMARGEEVPKLEEKAEQFALKLEWARAVEVTLAGAELDAQQQLGVFQLAVDAVDGLENFRGAIGTEGVILGESNVDFVTTNGEGVWTWQSPEGQSEQPARVRALKFKVLTEPKR